MASVSTLSPKNQSLELPRRIRMGIDEWVDVPSNPIQRDTERHARKASHLLTPHPSHMRVAMALMPDGSRCKLDGHTRAYLWDQGKVAPPEFLAVDIYECRTLGEAVDLYQTFDSNSAVESTTDKVHGAMRAACVEFESELLKSERYAGAMRVASEAMFGQNYGKEQTVYDLFAYWLPELQLLDACAPTRRRFGTGVATSALITLRRYGPKALDFWKLYSMGAGTKMQGEKDAVQALEERIENQRSQKQLSGRGNVQDIIRTCLSAFDSFQSDHNYKSGAGIKKLQDRSYMKWLERAAKTKRTW